MGRYLGPTLFAVAMFFAIRLIAAQTASPKVKTDQGRQWKEYAYPSDGFAIMLPDAPRPHEDSQVAGGTVYSIRLAWDTVASLHVASFPGGCADVFDRHVSAMNLQARTGKWTDARTDSNRLSYRLDAASLREFNFVGHPAAEYEEEVMGPGTHFGGYQRFQCVDKRFYIFQARWFFGPPRPTDVTRAISSFRLVEK